MTAPKVVLKANGKELSGWSGARVTRALEALAGSFSLTCFTGERIEAVLPGTECTVEIGGTPLVTGYVDRREPAFAADDASIAIQGRDRAGDLIDSSVVLDRWEFSNVSPLDLAKKIAAPYGVSVSLQPGLVLPPTSIPKKYAIDPGDTAGSALENLCRVAGVLPVSDGRGGVMLTRAGTERCDTALVEGKNVLAGSASFDNTGRFHRYLVLGQHKGTDTLHVDPDDWQGTPVSLTKGSALDNDPRIRAHRTLVVRPEQNTTAAQAKLRAEWEATVRAARAISVSITVAGWTQASGRLWPLNQIVPVWAPRLDIGRPKVGSPRGAEHDHGPQRGVDMLITEVVFSIDTNGGMTTQLKLRRPDAFLPEPRVLGPKLGWPELRDGVQAR